jgi:Flp pilus assembly protein CpaB
MKNKSMVLLAVAIGCGLVAAFLTAKLGAGNKQEMVPVLVAAKNLDQGTKLDKIEEQFVRKPFTRESLPPEYVDDPSMLKDKVLQRTIKAGSHCTPADLTPRNTVELPTDAKTGVKYKAMAIKVAPETGVSGLVLPGSRVDVVCVSNLPNGKTVTNMILQNVLVVSVDAKTERPDDQGFIKNAQTVTLAVKQREGMILANATEHGKVTLMLRDPDDKTVTRISGSISGDGQAPGQASDSSDDVGPGIEKTKVLVAKTTIAAGTQITDPEKLFEEKEWAGTVPSNFIIKVDDLKGKMVTKAIPANVPATKEAIEDVKLNPDGSIANTGDGKRHTMTFQISGNVPYYAHFREGKLEEGFAPPTSAPANGSVGSQEIKPGPSKDESKDEEKDKHDRPERKSDPG